MIRVFLVEDEIVMREGIRNRIPWNENGIDYCGDAGDGELAWPQILEKKPDIVITDIKMPFMDGLQLSRLIRRELPDIRIIILSGYDEFEYAQEAIQIGVTDYILKPVMPEEMLERIRKLAEKIEEEKKQNEARLDWMLEETRERREINRRKLFKALASGGSSTGQILKLCEELKLRIAAACYQILLVSIRKTEGALDPEYATSVANALLTITDLYEGCCLFEHGIDSYAILVSGNSQEELDSRREKILEQVSASIKATAGAHYFISMSQPVRRLSELHRAYREANRVFACRYFTQPDQIIGAENAIHVLPLTGDQQLINTDNMLRNDNLRTLWDRFLRTGAADEASDVVEGVFSTIGDVNTQSIVFLNYLLIDVYLAMGRFLKKLGREPKEVDGKCGDINSVLGSLQTVDDAKRYMTAYMQEVLKIRDGSVSSRNRRLLQEAVAFIDGNYADEEMSLSVAAKAAGMSPNRFSTAFSQEMGMTFIEYLTRKRIESAKELLMTTDLRSSEIAYRVGYRDPHYFSATFKRIQGESPREYRMRGRGDDANRKQ